MMRKLKRIKSTKMNPRKVKNPIIRTLYRMKNILNRSLLKSQNIIIKLIAKTRINCSNNKRK